MYLPTLYYMNFRNNNNNIHIYVSKHQTDVICITFTVEKKNPTARAMKHNQHLNLRFMYIRYPSYIM